jgi:hypothetical protein
VHRGQDRRPQLGPGVADIGDRDVRRGELGEEIVNGWTSTRAV